MQFTFAQAQSENTNVISEGQTEENDKFMNEIDIEYQTGGLSAIINSFNGIENIARQCPHVGGKAVYKARGYMYFINDSIIYDDAFVCSQAGFRKAATEKTKEVKESIKIVPNPASDKVTVELTGIDDGICKVQIRNVLNEVVYDSEFNCSDKNYLIHANNLSGGVYSITVNAANKKRLISKLTIVR